MERDDGGAPFLVPKLYVAAALADFGEAELLEGGDCLATGYDRQPWIQALSSRVAMIGGSISVGSG